MVGCLVEAEDWEGAVTTAVAAEVHMAPGRELAAVAFLNEFAETWKGSPRAEVGCALEPGRVPVPAFFPSFLRAGTCGAGWCAAGDLSEREGLTIEFWVGLRQRLDGDWQLAPLSAETVARVEARGPVVRLDTLPPVGVVFRSGELPVLVPPPPRPTAISPIEARDYLYFGWELGRTLP